MPYNLDTEIKIKFAFFFVFSSYKSKHAFEIINYSQRNSFLYVKIDNIFLQKIFLRTIYSFSFFPFLFSK